MKMDAGRLTVLFFLLFLAAAPMPSCRADPELDRTKADAKAAADKMADTFKDVVQEGKQVAGEVATNVVQGVKAGVQKAGAVATNVAAKVKEGAHQTGQAVTNVVGEVKQKVKKVSE